MKKPLSNKIGIALLLALLGMILLGLREPAAEVKTEAKEVLKVEVREKIKEIIKYEFKEPKTTEDKIRAVFAEHSDKAFLLLQGQGEGTCAENRTLDTEAINKNSDGTYDYGLFQLNSKWHGFRKTTNNKRYLFDPDINIRMAWRLFEDNGYRFNLWTCGEAYGI